MTSNALFCASQATQSVAIAVFLYEGFAYNWIFLWRILPAVGKGAFVIILALLFNTVWGLALWSYFAAHAADPGAVPRRWQEFVRAVGDALPIAPARPEWQPGKATFCKKCDVPRPERAHHCLICGICVLRMDHHCPWINNCVGFSNHKYFLLLGVYACLASITALVTSLPELIYVVGAVLHIGAGPPWEDQFVKKDGYISSRGETILEQRTTVDEAKRKCAALAGCVGFTFETNSTDWDDSPMHMYYKNVWDLAEPGSSWTSFHLEQAKTLEPSDIVVFLIFGALALFVVLLLTPMLATHLPLATQNLTTIEDNYENMPNPFDQGSTAANLAQIFGSYGPDWFFPIAPWRPLTDGVSFARSDERQFGPDGLQDRHMDVNDMEVEKLWRFRYYVRTPAAVVADKADNGPLSSLTRWWNGA